MHYIKIKDTDRQEIDVEVSDEVYQLLEDEHRELERERYERRAHLDMHELNDYLLERALTLPDATADHICLIDRIQNTLKTCTQNQRTRFAMYICGYSLSEIARYQHCHVTTVEESIKRIRKKIKNNI